MTEEGYSAARLGLKLGLGHVSSGATSLFELGGMGERMGIRRGNASPMRESVSAGQGPLETQWGYMDAQGRCPVEICRRGWQGPERLLGGLTCVALGCPLL